MGFTLSNVIHTALFLSTPALTPVALFGVVPVQSDASGPMRQTMQMQGLSEAVSSTPTVNLRVDLILNAGRQNIRSAGMGVLQVPRQPPLQSPDCTFFFPYNRWSDKSLGSLSSSGEISAFPATNTQLQQRSKIWRATSNAPYLLRDLGNAYRINSVCIVSHNMTATGTFRVRVGNSSTLTNPNYDSGTLRIWENSFATTGLMSEYADASGYPTDDTIELLRYCHEQARTVRFVTFEEVAARYVRVDFTDTANPLGYVEVAWLYAGLCVRINPDQLYGWNLWAESESRAHRSASGQIWIDNYYRQYHATAQFGSQPEANTMAFFEFLGSFLGKTRELCVAFQPVNAPQRFFHTMYCRLAQIPQIENVGFETYSAPIELEELV